MVGWRKGQFDCEALERIKLVCTALRFDALGLRFVCSKNRRRSGYYIDLGANVRITNQRFRYGVFIQLGSFGSSK